MSAPVAAAPASSAPPPRPRLLGPAVVNLVVGCSVLYTLLPVGWLLLAAAKDRDALFNSDLLSLDGFAPLANLRELVTTQLSHVELQPRPVAPPVPDLSQLRETHIDPFTGEDDADGDGDDTIAGALGATGSDPSLKPIDPQLLEGVSRNAPCPCGSGKKFKHCHGQF